MTPSGAAGSLSALAGRGGSYGIGIAGGAAGELERQHSFAAALGNQEQRADWRPEENPPAGDEQAQLERLRRQFERLVAQTLVQPLLKQAREANTAPPPWGPTPAEKQMGALLDEKIAEDITRRAEFPIVDRLARQMLVRRGLGGPSAPNPTTASAPAAPRTAAEEHPMSKPADTAGAPARTEPPTPARVAAMTPAERAEAVQKALAEIEATQAPLLEALKEQREATRSGDLDRLGEAIARTEAATGRAHAAEEHLAALLVAPTVRARLAPGAAAAPPLRVADIAAAGPAHRRGELLEASRRVREAAEAAQAEARVVRAATESLLAHSRGLQRAIAQRLSHAGTYSREGSVEPTRQAVVSSLDVSR